MISIGTVIPSSPSWLRNFKNTEKYKKIRQGIHIPQSRTIHYLYIFIHSLFCFLEKWMFTYKKMKSSLTNFPFHPSHTHPLPFSTLHRQPLSRVWMDPCNPFQKHTYIYVSITNIEYWIFVREDLIQVYKNVMVSELSSCVFIFLKVFDTILCNTYRSHM